MVHADEEEFKLATLLPHIRTVGTGFGLTEADPILWDNYCPQHFWPFSLTSRTTRGEEERDPGWQPCKSSLDLRLLLDRVQMEENEKKPNGNQADQARKKKSRTVLPTSLLETCLHHNILDRAAALNGRKRAGPTECRPPAGRGEADSVFTSLMAGAPPQSELKDKQLTHTLECEAVGHNIISTLFFFYTHQDSNWKMQRINSYTWKSLFEK